ncbi:hypothetical protein BVX95_00175 [archaeon D22]|nr:hypothetical protein BVX95_00175 [archaeon D22]
MVGEQFQSKLKHTFHSSKKIGKLIFKKEKLIKKYLLTLSDLFKELDSKDKTEGLTKETDEHLTEMEIYEKEAFKTDLEIEEDDQVYLNRMAQDLESEEDHFKKALSHVEQITFQDVTADQIGKVLKINNPSNLKYVREQIKAKLAKLFEHEEHLIEELRAEFKSIEKLARAQERDNEGLRTQVISMFSSMQVKIDAKVLKKLANEEDKDVKHIEDNLDSLDKILTHGVKNEKDLVELGKILRMVEMLEEHQDHIVHKVIKASFFIYKYAVYLFFKISRMLEKFEWELTDIEGKGFNEGLMKKHKAAAAEIKEFVDKVITASRHLATANRKDA